MNEAERKEHIRGLMDGLKCRCPGFSKMTQVRCKGVFGSRVCQFTCTHADKTQQTFPVGEPGLCRCGFGLTTDRERSFNLHEDQDGAWGALPCHKPKSNFTEIDLVREQQKEDVRVEQLVTMSVGAVVIAGMLFALRG